MASLQSPPKSVCFGGPGRQRSRRQDSVPCKTIIMACKQPGTIDRPMPERFPLSFRARNEHDAFQPDRRPPSAGLGADDDRMSAFWKLKGPEAIRAKGPPGIRPLRFAVERSAAQQHLELVAFRARTAGISHLHGILAGLGDLQFPRNVTLTSLPLSEPFATKALVAGEIAVIGNSGTM